MSKSRQEGNGPVEFFSFRTRKGWIGFCFRQDALLRLLLPAHRKRDMEARMRAEWGALAPGTPARKLMTLKKTLLAYYDGSRVDPARSKVTLCYQGLTPFRERIYNTLRAVPRGRVTTYGALAAMAGSPGAARGVGTAMARNPFPLIVPCHRVVGSDLKLHGFSAAGGVDTKRALLALEGWDGRSLHES